MTVLQRHMPTFVGWGLSVLFATLIALTTLHNNVATAQSRDPVIPNFWDPQERFIKPNLRGLPRLRFLTTTDFPPFSYIDTDKRLSGFHVDLARAICEELELLSVCQIQALPFKDLGSTLLAGNGEAIIAGQSINVAAREKFQFTRPYFRLPARFMANATNPVVLPPAAGHEKTIVGVVAGSAHAAFAQRFFDRSAVRLFADRDTAYVSLSKKEVGAIFDDGLAQSFWLQEEEGRKCCAFVGEPHISPTYFGQGLAIAVSQNNAELAEAMNFALRSINDKGIFAELYLRYFPISLY